MKNNYNKVTMEKEAKFLFEAKNDLLPVNPGLRLL